MDKNGKYWEFVEQNEEIITKTQYNRTTITLI